MDNWWKEAVIYQIYPRSFLDTSGNGVGDLNGITEKLKYISDLGVDAIWLSPFFTSPMRDMGYDVSNYTSVDPLFGEMHDFERLISIAHENKLKVIIDQVLSHSSDQLEAFKKSKKSKNTDKSDWYVWADAKSDGSPPNNWLSVFGGSAWEWNSEREQYYFHNFLPSQPDFNFHNEEVQNYLLDIVKFWLDKGVDGFRLDTVNYYFHDKKLRDNPQLTCVVGLNTEPERLVDLRKNRMNSLKETENIKYTDLENIKKEQGINFEKIGKVKTPVINQEHQEIEKNSKDRSIKKDPPAFSDKDNVILKIAGALILAGFLFGLFSSL